MRSSLGEWVGVVCVAGTLACYSSTGASGDASADDGADAAREIVPDTADAHEATPDDGRLDDAAADEGGTDDAACPAPQYWQHTFPTVVRAEPSPDVPPTEGQSARVVVWADIGSPGCGDSGRLFVWVDESTRTVQAGPEGWTNTDALAGACPPAEPVPFHVVLGGLSAGTWTVASEVAPLTLEILPCAGDCTCAGPPENRPEWSDCTLDCQCATGLACLGYFSRGTSHACLRSCNADVDCPWGETCGSADDGPTSVCWAGPIDLCGSAADCAPGWSCDCGGPAGRGARGSPAPALRVSWPAPGR